MKLTKAELRMMGKLANKLTQEDPKTLKKAAMKTWLVTFEMKIGDVIADSKEEAEASARQILLEQLQDTEPVDLAAELVVVQTREENK